MKGGCYHINYTSKSSKTEKHVFITLKDPLRAKMNEEKKSTYIIVWIRKIQIRMGSQIFLAVKFWKYVRCRSL